MAYPSPSLLLTWGGQIGNTAPGTDVWTCGLHLGIDGPAAPLLPGVVPLGNLYGDVLAPFHQSSEASLSSGAVIQWAKIALLAADGSYEVDPVVYNGASLPGGMSMTDSGAPQLSMCITLWSGQTLGKGNYGRFYLPWYANPASRTNGRITAGARDQLADRATTFVQAVDTWAGSNAGGAQVRIFSKAGAGSKKVPTTLRVGDVIDTQRRRRNKIRENYAARAL